MIMNDVKKDIIDLMESSIPTFRISKETDTCLATVQNYRSGKGKIDNMTIKIASKFCEYVERLKKDGEL